MTSGLVKMLVSACLNGKMLKCDFLCTLNNIISTRVQRVEERSILAGNRVHHTALILQELAVYEKEPASVVKVTEEGDLNIMANDDNEAEYDLKN